MCPCSMTNGGKSTLTSRLHRALPNCCVIHQDDFFKVAARAGVGGWRGRGAGDLLGLMSPGVSVPRAGDPLG